MQTLEVLARPGRGHDIHLLNAYSIALAHSDSAFAACVKNSTHNFPDGKPVAFFSRYMAGKLHQVRGPQYFEDVLAAGVETGVKHYFLGSTPDTLALLQAKVEARLPNVRIVGAFSPPFRELTAFELAEQDAAIRMCDPDIVWVGLGTPKQDFEARRLAEEGFNSAAVGAAFDFSAGTKKQAPNWVRGSGLEWLHRLLSEPRRLWKRYLWGNTVFLTSVLREIWRK
ncbi:WecB/TagA/CpsF family glycosyltransferase [Paenarthrobacter sp. 22069]|uniref:WecB/TagA/CpsF family glycosyltransferase n=1 Tax=Paenarthrobacter sp. 22069 TaxID=3453864 RepID=UPI003F85D3FD